MWAAAVKISHVMHLSSRNDFIATNEEPLINCWILLYETKCSLSTDDFLEAKMHLTHIKAKSKSNLRTGIVETVSVHYELFHDKETKVSKRKFDLTKKWKFSFRTVILQNFVTFLISSFKYSL